MSKLSTKVEWWLPKALVEELERRAREGGSRNTTDLVVHLLRVGLDEPAAEPRPIRMLNLDDPEAVEQFHTEERARRQTHAPEMDERIAMRIADHTRLGERIDELRDYTVGVEDARARLGTELGMAVDRILDLEAANRAIRQQLDELVRATGAVQEAAHRIARMESSINDLGKAVVAYQDRLDEHLRLHPADTNESVEALDHRLELLSTRLDELVASIGEDNAEPVLRAHDERLDALEAWRAAVRR